METVSGGDCVESSRGTIEVMPWSSRAIWAFQVVKLWLLDSLMGNCYAGLNWIRCLRIMVMYWVEEAAVQRKKESETI